MLWRLTRAVELFDNDRGQTVLEYALIIAILVIGMVATINNFGTGILTMAADRVDVLVP